MSSQDFEELVRDLLSAEWHVALECFTAGRDRGIDLRYAPAGDGTTIVQCKHFLVSGFSKLLRHLVDLERPKVEKLNPDRYVLVTSVGLTPDNKGEIYRALAPFIKSVGDIIGSNDLEAMLGRHPAVEQRNFKLWLTSTAVLERVLHNAELCQTDFEIERIHRKLPLFVQNDAFPRAMRLLEQERIVVISGVPGIGKTTLAEMLLYAHLEQGYEPVVIQTEIAEAKKLFRSDVCKIFYYDDFLGQIFLGDRSEYLGTNQDAAIVDFIEQVRSSPKARFVLTTREHILRSALQISEKFAHSAIRDYRCVLELKDYSYGQRARILYNHLYFSGLPAGYKDVILEDDFFLTIIKHKHFNPRLIEWLSSEVRLRNVVPREYRAHVITLLESPETIWQHAFQNQISSASRDMLCCFYTVGEWADTRDLELPFVSFRKHCANKYKQSISATDFRYALSELDGAFISYHSGNASFINPSIREFVAVTIASNQEIAEDLLISAVRFKQLVNLRALAAARPDSELNRYIAANLTRFCEALARVLQAPAMRWEKMQDGSRRGYPVDISLERRIRFLVELSDDQKSEEVMPILRRAVESLVSGWTRVAPEFDGVLAALDAMNEKAWFIEHGGRQLYRYILDGLLGELDSAYARDWLAVLAFRDDAFEWTDDDDARVSIAMERYRSGYVNDEWSRGSTLDDKVDLKEALTELNEKYGIDLAAEIRRLGNDIAEHEGDTEPDWERGSADVSSAAAPQSTMTDDEVREMFHTLRDTN